MVNSGTDTHHEGIAVAERLAAAIAARDVEAVGELFADSITVWHNYNDSSQSKSENLAVLGRILRYAEEAAYENIRRIPIEAGFVEQHDLAFCLPGGQRIALPICMVAKVRDGQITQLDEYLDPRPLLEALPPTVLHGEEGGQ